MRGPGNSNPSVACLNTKVPVHDPAVETEPITMDAAAAEREKSFSAFVASHRERAIRLAWQCIGGDEAAAEDVAQEAFILVYLEGFTVRECAEVLGKPHGTICSHLHRARTLLRTELADLYERMEEP